MFDDFFISDFLLLLTMATLFLTISPEGRQLFWDQNGQCSLRLGDSVTTHHSDLNHGFTTDPELVVGVSQLPPSTILSRKTIERMIGVDDDGAMKGME